MSVDLQEIWSLLETSIPLDDQLRVREVTGIDFAEGSILLGLDVHHHRHLLIPVAHNERIISDKRSSGVQILPHPLLDRGTLQPFVDLVCLKPHLDALFSILVDEILDLLRKDSTSPDKVCRQVLDRWRELLEREPVGTINMEKLVGVFGELWFLREMIQRNSNAIRYWTGPRGAPHDFSVGNLAIEVKSTLARRGLFIEIHGHDQLERPQNGSLYLSVLKIEQEPLLGESLSQMIEAIVNFGGDKNTLLQMLAQVDVRLLAFDQYKDIRFRLNERRIYEVDDKFPSITSHSFVGGVLPRGIISLSYKIDLTSEPQPLSENAVMMLLTTLSSLMEAS